MYIVHEATIKNTDGVIDIQICIVSDKIRRYNYHIGSEDAAEKFHHLYKKGRSFHGKALAVLNNSKIANDEKPGFQYSLNL